MKQAKLSITVKKVQAKIVSIKLVHPLSCTTKQHHSTVQTSVFTYYSFFYNFKVLSYAYLAHMPVNSLLAPPLVNESSAFSVKEVQHRTSPKPQKMKKVQKNGIFSRDKTHHTHMGLWWRADTAYCQSIPVINLPPGESWQRQKCINYSSHIHWTWHIPFLTYCIK